MLFLLFHLGSTRYAIDARSVAEVLPLVQVAEIPGAPRGVAGVLIYRGVPVPVVDLTEIVAGRPSSRRLSTRVILAHYGESAGQPRLIGLIAEHATDTVRREASDFAASTVGNALHQGPVATDNLGVIHWIEPDTLLSPAVRDALVAGRPTP